ncbi:MAG: hypothetical protein IPP66_15340 [Anaerolineales bacterium]|nr:hypothetical protein [Anaerolineales bacterium]
MVGIKKEKIAGYILIAAPLIGYWVYWTRHPSYWFNGDPAAFYLIDSLSVFIGKTYTYVDHPGTPIHLIGSLILAVTRPFFQDINSFIQFFITKPVVFFIMAHAFLLVTCLLTAGYFFNTAYSSLKNFRFIGAITLPLAYFVFHPQSFHSLTLWSHNSLNYPFGTLWLLWLYNELRKETKLSRNFLLLSGATVGILATVHIYFFTWVAGGILTIFIYTIRISRSYKNGISAILIFLLGTIAGIISMLIPVYKELPRFAAWLIEISTHTGMYGMGETGVFSLEIIAIAVRFWWASIPLTMVMLITSIFTVIWLVRQARKIASTIPSSVQAMVVGLLFQIALLLILFTKAAVKLRYTLTLAAVVPVLLLVVINLFEFVNLKRAKWTGVVHAAILISMAITLPQEINLALEKSYYEEEVEAAKTQVVSMLAEELDAPKDEVKVVFAYGTPLKCANMLIASDYTGHLKNEVSAMCPNQYGIYDTKIKLNPAQPLVDIRDIEWDLVVWPGNGSDLPKYLKSVNAVNIPLSWRVQRLQWYYVHSGAIKQK